MEHNLTILVPKLLFCDERSTSLMPKKCISLTQDRAQYIFCKGIGKLSYFEKSKFRSMIFKNYVMIKLTELFYLFSI